ncbi:MAG: response regulator [Defluviitaleaceae bacterium]|nr:response regulator [Defluviitaleaceae bacterium]
MVHEFESAEIKEIILNSSPFIMNIWDDTPKHIDTNRRSLEIFGLSSKREFIERFYELSPEYQPCGTLSRQKSLNYVKEAFETGRVQFEWMHQTLTGEPLPIEVTMVRFTSKGKNMLVAYGVDLRPVKAALEKEYEAHKTIQTVFDSSPVVINIWDDKGNLMSTSEHALELHNVSSKEEYIKNFSRLSPERQPDGTLSAESIPALMNKAYEEGYARFEWLHCTLDGKPIPTEVTLVRFVRHGKIMIVAYITDLTQIKAAMKREQDALAESNAAKSRFLARMSHEIRTPISAVMGISEIYLQKTDLPPDIEEAFAKINNSSITLLQLVNDILDLSKIEASKMTLLPKKYCIASMINDVMHLHAAHIGNKKIKFKMKVDENLPVFLIGDVLRIKQIMTNLLSNAFKYTEKGFVELSLRYENYALLLSICDTGIGMTPAQVDTLRKSEYTRFHEGETPHISGTGLGMPIVFNLVQMMYAKINIESESGKGTTVSITIPQEPADDQVIGKKTALQLQRFKINTKKSEFVYESMTYGRVLVVDDIGANIYVARGLLAFYDLHIDSCESGYEAIEKIRQGNVYDIVFMDQMMPGMDGTQTMNAMREMGYTAPIIALTANALIGQSEDFINRGFDGFISKPIQTKHLHSVLVKHVRDKHIQGIENFQRDHKLIKTLSEDFVRNHSQTFSKIKKAVEAGDLKTAHFLSHTVKGVAGLIYEDTMVKAAQDIENILADDMAPTSAQMDLLEAEFSKLIKTPHTNDNVVMLDKLIILLETRDSKAQDLAEGLRSIPEAAILCKQIENFDFGAALVSANILKEILYGA